MRPADSVGWDCKTAESGYELAGKSVKLGAFDAGAKITTGVTVRIQAQ